MLSLRTRPHLGSAYVELLNRFEACRPIESWIRFHGRRAAESGFQVQVRQKGDARRGSVVIMLRDATANVQILTMVRSSNGRTVWLPVHGGGAVNELRAERYVERLARTDPDLWILDVEPSAGGGAPSC